MEYKPQTILSSNRKTVIPSLNLPRSNCSPSKLCRDHCYAKQGHMALPVAEKKQRWVSDYLLGDDLSQFIDECHMHSAVRLCGGGDLFPKQALNILKAAEVCKETLFWGFSRKPVIVTILNNQLPNVYMQLSVDHTTPVELWEDMECDISYGPRMQEDDVPEDTRIRVVFPYHVRGRVVNGVSHHRKDCHAVWDHNLHCYQCRRCYPTVARKG